MPTRSDEMLRQMRASFAEQLPLRLDAIRQAVTAMLCQPWDVRHVGHLQHLLHNLIGASGTFGLATVGLSARCMDDVAAPLAERADYPGPAELQTVRNALSQLELSAASNFNQDENESTSPQITVRHGPPLMIYIVDDDPLQADVLFHVLTENSYQARVFTTLNEFRDACLQEPLPFAIIMDMIFPEGGLAGAQTIAELKYQHLGGLPIIFISIRDDLQARLAAFRAGATRYLHKPIQHRQLLRILDELALNIPRKPYHVLLVDDEPLLLEFHAEILRAAGIVVRTETNPLNTLEALHEFQPDVLLLDVYMPECQGPELAAVIREQECYAYLPILFLSAETDMVKQLMALDLGGDDFLVKPVEPLHLVMVIKSRAQRMRRLVQMIETLNESLLDFVRLQKQKQSNGELRDEIALLEHTEQGLRVVSAAFETQDAIMITDQNVKILRVNQSFEEITGYAAEEVIGKTPKILQSGRHDTIFYQHMWHELTTTGKWVGEIWDKRKNGVIYPKWMTITAVRNEFGLVSHFVAVFRDISETKHAEEEIRNLAFYDQLTGLPNRHLLFDRLRTAFFASDRSQQYGALLFIDIDNFKHLNDTQGHAAGDLMLTEFARRLLASIREVDTAARHGGDEFVVLLEDLHVEAQEAATQASVVAEKIRHALSEPYQLGNSNQRSSPSIGVALFRAHNQTIEELLKFADSAMYRAKKCGRNTVCFFDPDMQAALEARTGLEAELRHALPEQQLQLYFQMQVDNNHDITGAEVLLRWNHPQAGLLTPNQFIQMAEDSGLILPIGLWVMQSACAQLKYWEQNPHAQHLNLAVNISLRQLLQSDFVEQVQQHIDNSGINPARLKFEISEKMVLANFKDTCDKINALAKIGVHFAIDDFGIGYSSLAYLRKLPLAHIKIDKSFIASITTDSGDEVMVQAINNIAKNFGLHAIAEGVETEEQLTILKRNACEAFQGYLFGKPVTLPEFERLLQRP